MLGKLSTAELKDLVHRLRQGRHISGALIEDGPGDTTGGSLVTNKTSCIATAAPPIATASRETNATRQANSPSNPRAATPRKGGRHKREVTRIVMGMLAGDIGEFDQPAGPSSQGEASKDSAPGAFQLPERVQDLDAIPSAGAVPRVHTNAILSDATPVVKHKRGLVEMMRHFPITIQTAVAIVASAGFMVFSVVYIILFGFRRPANEVCLTMYDGLGFDDINDIVRNFFPCYTLFSRRYNRSSSRGPYLNWCHCV